MGSGVAFLTDTQSAASLPERRHELRRVCRVGVALHLPGISPLKGRTVDVSPAGVALLLAHPLKPGTTCHVCFVLYVNGVAQDIAAGAEVTNCVFLSTNVRIGLRFTSLDAQAQKALSTFVR